MNLLESLLTQNSGALVKQLAQNFDIGEGQAQSAVTELLPSLARGLGRNAQQQGGLDALFGALKAGNHQRYVDHPEELGRRETVKDGNDILGHILGSKDVSRNVAGRASQQSGLSSGLLKQMLPVIASMVMGSLSKQASGGGSLSQLGGSASSSSSPGLDILTSFLDSDRDGSILDDVLNLAQKFL